MNYTEEDHLHALMLVAAHGYITHFDWGCKVGVHAGWAILEADSEQEALLAVPSLTRSKASAVLLIGSIVISVSLFGFIQSIY